MRSFSDSLPMVLLRARDATMAHFSPIFRDHGITEPQWRVLRALMETDDTCMDISDLSRTCSVLQPSMSRILRNLEARDLVWRRTHERDQRSVLMALTSKGRDMFLAIMPRVEQRYADIAARIGQDDMNELYRVLRKFELSLNGKASPCPIDKQSSRKKKNLPSEPAIMKSIRTE